MTLVDLRIPIIVNRVKASDHIQFELRPLFLPYPSVRGNHFDDALTNFKEELKSFFKGFVLSASTKEHLLWFLFQPNYVYHKVAVSYKVGRYVVDGIMLAVSFEMEGIPFIILPQLDDYVFVPQLEQGAKTIRVEEEVNRVSRALLQRIFKEEGQLRLEQYYMPAKQFISFAEVKINVEEASYGFEKSLFSMLFSQQQNEGFDGAIETERVGYSYNQKYPEHLDRALYREAEVAQLSGLMLGDEKIPLAIIGEAGVGKSAVLEEVIYRYLEEHKDLAEDRERKFWNVDPNRVISGMSYVGDWQRRFESIIEFIGDGAMIVENAVALLHVGRSGSDNMTLKDVLKPYLEKRNFRVILLATTDEWKVIEKKEKGFSDLFERVYLWEQEEDIAIKILLHKRQVFEQQYNCWGKVTVIEQLIKLHRRYTTNEVLPGSLVKSLASLMSKRRNRSVTIDDVQALFEESRGLEGRILDVNTTFEKGEVEKALSRSLIGQPQAVAVLANAVHLVKSRLSPTGKPISSFLFVGPTGVGKTEAAKALNKYLAGKDADLLRFDMNEYIDVNAAERLVGSFEQPEGILPSRVRNNPFGVLLFDEIEKAYPTILDLLLQILDDGRLTDARGQVTDFSNTIIIMTSNIGAEKVDKTLGFNPENRDNTAIYKDAIERAFRPEFINRIDEIVSFDPLGAKEIERIAKLQINELLKRDGFVRRTTILNITEDALNWVANRGHDQRMGGRALKRQIEKDLTQLSAEYLLKMKGDSSVIFNIYLENEKLIPQLQALTVVEIFAGDVLPHNEQFNRSFARTMLYQANDLIDGLREMEDDLYYKENTSLSPQDDWLHFHYSGQLYQLKDQLENANLGYRQAHQAALRLKRILLYKDIRQLNVEQILKEEIFSTIRNRYKTDASILYDGDAAAWLSMYLRLQLVKLQHPCVLGDDYEEVTLSIRSLVDKEGEEEIVYLLGLYQKMLNFFDITYELDVDNKCLYISEFSTRELLLGELGVHLFFSKDKMPLPLEVMINYLPNKDAVVARLYNECSFMYDIQTGLALPGDIQEQEMAAMVIARHLTMTKLGS